MKRKYVISVMLIFAIVLSTLSAQKKITRDVPPNPSEILTKMDANKDQKLSIDEVEGPLKNDFSSVDTNNDGFIVLAELKEAKPNRKGKKRGKGNKDDRFFKKMDTNSDQKISIEEAKGKLAKDFERLDKNNDGFISEAELPKPPKSKKR